MSVYFLVIVIGWGVGIVVNYLSDFLPENRKLVHPYCLNCGAKLEWGNYLFWPRLCMNCSIQRHWRVWLVEAIFVAVSVRIWMIPPERLGFFPGLLLLGYLGVVTVIDIEHRLILHLVSFVGIIIGIVLGFTAHGLRSTLIGGAAGFGIMATLYLFGIIFVRMLSRWVKPIDEIALGFGDVNLGIVTGLLLGWPGIIVGILITILVSGAVSLLYLIYSLVRRSYRPTMVFPLGPFLVLSIIILLYLK